MLPEKRKLRKYLEPYREPPKAVLSFFRKNDGEAEYAVIGKTFSAEGKSVYALLYYSPERLKRASFINRNFDCIDVVPHTPVKWYQTILFTKNEVKTVLLNAGGFYSYFKVSNRNNMRYTHGKKPTACKGISKMLSVRTPRITLKCDLFRNPFFSMPRRFKATVCSILPTGITVIAWNAERIFKLILH